jgi:hypothetical protein
VLKAEKSDEVEPSQSPSEFTGLRSDKIKETKCGVRNPWISL